MAPHVSSQIIQPAVANLHLQVELPASAVRVSTGMAACRRVASSSAWARARVHPAADVQEFAATTTVDYSAARYCCFRARHQQRLHRQWHKHLSAAPICKPPNRPAVTPTIVAGTPFSKISLPITERDPSKSLRPISLANHHRRAIARSCIVGERQHYPPVQARFQALEMRCRSSFPPLRFPGVHPPSRSW